MTNTRLVILETLSQRGALPIDEIARAANHTPLALRYHLTRLLAEGLIVAQTTAHRAVVGRPQVQYALADPAHEQLPKQYPWLAQQLLTEIESAFDAKTKRALLRRVGKRIAAAAPALRPNARLETRVAHTADFLTAHGYMARWEKNAGGFQVDVCNCPYRQVVRVHAQVCEMDRALIDGLLGTPSKMTSCLASQNCNCRFVVKAKVR